MYVIICILSALTLLDRRHSATVVAAAGLLLVLARARAATAACPKCGASSGRGPRPLFTATGRRSGCAAEVGALAGCPAILLPRRSASSAPGPVTTADLSDAKLPKGTRRAQVRNFPD
jgi:hypothetical protein